MQGSKSSSLGTVVSPSQAVPQNVDVRHARIAAFSGSLGLRAAQIVVRLSMVQGTFTSFFEPVGVSLLPPVRRACSLFSSTLQGTPCMMCHA